MGIWQGLCGSDSLYAAWKGEVGDVRLFFSKLDGGTWKGQGNVIPGNSSVGPSLAATDDGRIWAAWKGEGNDQRLFYAFYITDTNSWSEQAWPFPSGMESTVGPSLAANGFMVYAAWTGPNNDPTLYFASLDTTSSSPTWQSLPGLPTPPSATPSATSSSIGPALAIIGDMLYAAWTDLTGKIQYAWFNTFNGGWVGQSDISGVSTSIGVSLASIRSILYAACKGSGSHQNLSYASLDTSTAGAKFSTMEPIPSHGSSIGPALAALGDMLYAMWTGSGDDPGLYYASLDTTQSKPAWSGFTPIGGNTGQDMVPPPLGGLGGQSNYVVYDNCEPLMNLTVTVAFTQDTVLSGGNPGEGIGFQLNAYSSPKQSVGWQQIMMGFGPAPTFHAVVQLWGPNSGQGEVLSVPSSTVTPAIDQSGAPAGDLIIAHGYSVEIKLGNDPSTKNVTSAAFSVYLDVPGSPRKTVGTFLYFFPAEYQAPIVGLQLNITGPSYLSASGAGTITYEATNELTVVPYPIPCPGVRYLVTNERTTSCYGQLRPAASKKIPQSFFVDPALLAAHGKNPA